MKYYKLKISLKNYEDKLNRTIMFRENNDLNELAFTILSIFNTLAYHLYCFNDKINKYECEISLIEAEEMGYPDKGMDCWLVTIDKLHLDNNKFTMTYDFGENYEFVIEVLGEEERNGKYKIPEVIDGTGYGIVEDDRISFEEFLDGKPLEYPLRFIKSGRYMQVDFNEFDLEECNKKLKKEFSKIRNAYNAYI